LNGQRLLGTPARVALAAAAVLFAASLLYHGHRLQLVHEAALETASENLWHVHQAEFELQRLLAAVNLRVADPGAMSPAELRQRFDVVWSWFDLLDTGPDVERLPTLEQAAALKRAGVATLAGIEPQLADIPADPRAYATVRDALSELQPPLHDLLLRTLHATGSAHSAFQERIGALRSVGTLSLFGLLLSAGILVFVLTRQLGTTRELLASVRRLADHDDLTGLPNRRVFEERLARALADARRRGEHVAVHFVDLDHFKQVNDRFGHRSGNQLLVEVARRIRATARETDVVARLGGDEFAMVQTALEDQADSFRLAQRLRMALTQPFALDGAEATPSASIGVSLFPDDAGSPDRLLHYADLAAYCAKAAGRNRIERFSPTMTGRPEPDDPPAPDGVVVRRLA
jgi:diguanylate cyclase (GGDEF)-like protein